MKDLHQMRADLIVLANDEIGMDDYKSQLRRYQILLLGIIDYLIEKETLPRLDVEIK